MKKLYICILLLVFTFFTGCSGTEDKIDIPVQEQNTQQIYLMRDSTAIGLGGMHRLDAGNGEYLLAFFGRKEGEEKSLNRAVYLNKYNNIYQEVVLPQEVNTYDYEFFFTTDYVLAYNVNDFGLDSDGNPHGFSVFDTQGNQLVSYGKRYDSVTGYKEDDAYTQLNMFWPREMIVKNSHTLILTSPVAIYEYDMEKDSFKKLLDIEDVYETGTSVLDSTDYIDALLYGLGISKTFYGEETGITFTVNEDKYSDDATVYNYDGKKLNQLTEKNGTGYIVRYNPETDCLIYGTMWDYNINGENYKEYSMPLNYQREFYPALYNLEELNDGQVRVRYFDSRSMQHYDLTIDRTNPDFFRYVKGGYENYLYLGSYNGQHICRLDVKTGESVFIVSDEETEAFRQEIPFCPEYWISATGIVIDYEGLTEIQIYCDELI